MSETPELDLSNEHMIYVRIASSLAPGGPAPPNVADIGRLLTALGAVLKMSELLYERNGPENRLCLREAHQGSLELALQIVPVVGTVVAAMSGNVPTAVANFVACLQAVKAMAYAPKLLAEHIRSLGGHRRPSNSHVRDVLAALASSTARVGEIEIRSPIETIILKDVDFTPRKVDLGLPEKPKRGWWRR